MLIYLRIDTEVIVESNHYENMPMQYTEIFKVIKNKKNSVENV